MTRVPNTLIGRAEEVLAIDRTVSELGHGGSAAIEVAGEPGIGKTRLLAELATRADALGYLVLSGSASELEADLPFWVFVDALDEYVAALEPRRLDAIDDDVLGELATVFPALTSRASVPYGRSSADAVPDLPGGAGATGTAHSDQTARTRARRRPLG